MNKFKNLKLIGTSHIAIQSIKEVKNLILKNKPKIVALELDKRRFYTLIYNKKTEIKLSNIKKIGLKGFIFVIISFWIQKTLGQKVGILPGTEMKTAVKAAKKVKADIALIDQDISITLKKISKEMPWKEKLKFIKEVIKGLIFKKQEIKIDLTKVPSQSLIRKLTKIVKKEFPVLYKILIKERNEIMAKNLYNLINNNKDKEIIAVVGAGHEQEIINLIKRCEKLALQK